MSVSRLKQIEKLINMVLYLAFAGSYPNDPVNRAVSILRRKMRDKKQHLPYAEALTDLLHIYNHFCNCSVTVCAGLTLMYL